MELSHAYCFQKAISYYVDKNLNLITLFFDFFPSLFELTFATELHNKFEECTPHMYINTSFKTANIDYFHFDSTESNIFT